jgi:hypothetical protein
LRTLEKRDQAKPIPLFEKFRDFSTGLSLLEGVNSWVLNFSIPFVNLELFYSVDS